MGHSVTMRRALPLFLLLVLVGCKGSREKEFIGTWNTQNAATTLTEDKKFTTTIGGLSLEGTWTFEGDDATLTPATVAGKPVAEVKSTMQGALGRLPAAQQAMAKGFVEAIDTPNVLTLSADGKTLVTNKAKDKNPGPAMTWTKA